nr:zinc finger, CCHC-type [Tanacetum cinerariifolium]
FQYLKGTMDYGLTYSGYPSVIEGYSDASWINNMEDHSSTSGWVFLLGGGAIFWASQKQTCITSSTIESEFVALAAAGNEAEWLRNLVYEILLCPKHISTISIRCDGDEVKNEITNFRQRPDESLFEAWEHYKFSIDRCPNHNMLPVTQIDTFYNGLTLRHRDTINAAAGGTFMKRRPEECYDLIENMTNPHNDWDTSAQRSESSSSITSSSDTEIAAQKAEMVEINKNLMRVLQPQLTTLRTYMLREPIKGASHGQNPPPAYQAPAYHAPVYQASVHQPPIPQQQVVTTNEFTNLMKANDAIVKNMQTNMTSLTNSNHKLKNMFGQFMKMNTASSLGLGTLPGNTITNLKEDLKGITTQSGTAYQGPTIPTTSSSFPLVVERETEATKDTVHPTNNGSTKDVQPPVVPTKSPILNSEQVIAPIIEPVASTVSASKPNQRPSIHYPSRLHDQKLRDKSNDQ